MFLLKLYYSLYKFFFPNKRVSFMFVPGLMNLFPLWHYEPDNSEKDKQFKLRTLHSNKTGTIELHKYRKYTFISISIFFFSFFYLSNGFLITFHCCFH